uniref:Uncharacterized protein n=1 Tax=Anguilla anguilla TaxID=7936 RepID=A0A0E9SK25_ANGAN
MNCATAEGERGCDRRPTARCRNAPFLRH